MRARPVATPFHIVLVEPEIPPNTGAIARTCAATGSPLHLVGPLGFRIDAQAVRRAGLDYWPAVQLQRHADFANFAHGHTGSLHLFSAQATQSYLDAPLRPGDALVFGKESVGLPPALLDAHAGRVWGIPTLGPVRSLNLSNAVAIVLYEALRQSGALQHSYMASEAP